MDVSDWTPEQEAAVSELVNSIKQMETTIVASLGSKGRKKCERRTTMTLQKHLKKGKISQSEYEEVMKRLEYGPYKNDAVS